MLAIAVETIANHVGHLSDAPPGAPSGRRRRKGA